MRAYFTFRGVNSKDMGVWVTALPPIVKPERRETQITIPGRHGVLHQSENTYGNYTKEVECALLNTKKRPRYTEIVNWLDGYGELVFSSEPEFVYRATVAGQIPIEKVIQKVPSFLVQFDVYPLRYSASAPDDFLAMVTAGTIYNRGTYNSEPIITVYGSGEVALTINGTAYTISDVDGYVTINSEIQEVYKDTINKNSTFSAADFPVFRVGENTIRWTGAVTRVEIMPQWRWI